MRYFGRQLGLGFIIWAGILFCLFVADIQLGIVFSAILGVLIALSTYLIPESVWDRIKQE